MEGLQDYYTISGYNTKKITGIYGKIYILYHLDSDVLSGVILKRISSIISATEALDYDYYMLLCTKWSVTMNDPNLLENLSANNYTLIITEY